MGKNYSKSKEDKGKIKSERKLLAKKIAMDAKILENLVDKYDLGKTLKLLEIHLTSLRSTKSKSSSLKSFLKECQKLSIKGMFRYKKVVLNDEDLLRQLKMYLEKILLRRSQKVVLNVYSPGEEKKNIYPLIRHLSSTIPHLSKSLVLCGFHIPQKCFKKIIYSPRKLNTLSFEHCSIDFQKIEFVQSKTGKIDLLKMDYCEFLPSSKELQSESLCCFLKEVNKSPLKKCISVVEINTVTITKKKIEKVVRMCRLSMEILRLYENCRYFKYSIKFS
ncbi:unnamed protein product [Moneuplotes crassus]|uniref:Uncharacterized protein n=2 Tax=Euplotes crassus TaxID=5936 RepID=A0AAD2D233_EUPCR|nr:unnamed protein product [Moneuplotes crassus]